jgi:hypothetical protein
MTNANTSYDETRNEVARRNYAITTETFDCENMLQIKCGGEVLVTVTAPAGPPVAEVFAVYNGNGLDENDEDMAISDAVKTFPVKGDVNDAWRQAARYGYLHALGVMMTRDAREEREAYEFAA